MGQRIFLFILMQQSVLCKRTGGREGIQVKSLVAKGTLVSRRYCLQCVLGDTTCVGDLIGGISRDTLSFGIYVNYRNEYVPVNSF